MARGTPSKTGVAIQLSGGHAGPDGIEMDAENGLVVCHLGVGVWRFDANCLPTHLVHADGHRLLTNVAFGGPDLRTLFFTANTSVYTLRTKVPGQPHPWYRVRGQRKG
jgi:gluconolactonase